MKNKITRYEELANRIIDLVSDVVEEQHPEISLNTTIARASGIQNPAVICGEGYYNLEDEIAEEIKNSFRRWKTAKKTSRKIANKIKINAKRKLMYLRKRAYVKNSYEESYVYLMDGIDKIIEELKSESCKKWKRKK